MSKIRLYYTPRTRAVRPRWLLEELEVPYELVRIDMAKGEHKTPQYLAIHPHGVVPALVDGDLKMFESAAICMYLADKYADKQLAPMPGTPQRGTYYQWMVYTMATLEPPVLQVFMNTVMLPEAQRSTVAVDEGRRKFVDVARVLGAALEGKPFLLGARFSAADVMIGSSLAWAQGLGLIAGHVGLEDYVKRVVARPAYQRARAD